MYVDSAPDRAASGPAASFRMASLALGSGALLLGLVVTIIAGLMFATGLTMIVVPTLYAIFYKVREEPPA